LPQVSGWPLSGGGGIRASIIPASKPSGG